MPQNPKDTLHDFFESCACDSRADIVLHADTYQILPIKYIEFCRGDRLQGRQQQQELLNVADNDAYHEHLTLTLTLTCSKDARQRKTRH